MRAHLFSLGLTAFALAAMTGCPGPVQTVYVYLTPTPGPDGAAPNVVQPAGGAPAPGAPADPAAPAVTPTPPAGAPGVSYATPTPRPSSKISPLPTPSIGVEGVGQIVTIEFPPVPDAEHFALPTAARDTLARGTANVSGSVLDFKTRRGIGDAWVSIVSAADPAKRADVKTGSNGAYTFSNVAAGGYYATAQKPGVIGGQSPQFVNVGTGSVAGVTFALYVR